MCLVGKVLKLRTTNCVVIVFLLTIDSFKFNIEIIIIVVNILNFCIASSIVQ